MTQMQSMPTGAPDRPQASAVTKPVEVLDVLVIGGGQAGLSVGYHLKQRGLSFKILDANQRVGDSWRQRWQSLRLFTPAWLDSLDGMAFPASAHHFPTKDEMADYLESYAERFDLPLALGVRVTSLTRTNGVYRVRTEAAEYRARNVVVAMSSYQRPRVPVWARELNPDIVQLHSSEYKHPGMLRAGPVLIAGAGNSGAEIAMELSARGQRVLLAGRDTGHVPFRIAGFWARWVLVRLLLRVVFHRILTVRTPIGRRARPRMISRGGPLIRQHPEDLEQAGVERLGRVAGSAGGLPRLENGNVLNVTNVIWATGFASGLDYIDLPIFDAAGEVRHQGGVVPDHAGLYFVGQNFLYSFSSTMIHGVGRDAARIVRHIAERAASN
ncbi:MAG: flavin-containing monooxygenase [Myxococcota bacterium]